MTHYAQIMSGAGTVYRATYHGRTAKATRISAFAVRADDGQLFSRPEDAVRASYRHHFGTYDPLPTSLEIEIDLA